MKWLGRLAGLSLSRPACFVDKGDIVMYRSFVNEENLGKSATIEDGPNERLFEFVRIPDGESFNDSSARIVMTCASMMEPAMMLSAVLLLWRPSALWARGSSVERLVVLGNNLGSEENGNLGDDELLLSEPLGVPALERLCTTRTLSLLNRLKGTSRARSARFPPSDLGLSSIDILIAERWEGSWRNCGNAVNMLLSRLRPLDERYGLSLAPCINVPKPIPSISENVRVISPSVSSQSESDDPSSKKSAPGWRPLSIVSLIAG